MNRYTDYDSIVRLMPKPGGVCKVHFAPWQNFIFPKINPVTGTITSNIQLTDNYLYLIEMAQASQVYNIEVKSGSGGMFFSCLLQGKTKGYNEKIENIIHNLSAEKLAVLFYDNAGIWRIMGTKDAGASFSFSYTTGDRNGSRELLLKFTIEHKSTPYIIDRAVADLIISDNDLSQFFLVNDKIFTIDSDPIIIY